MILKRTNHISKGIENHIHVIKLHSLVISLLPESVWRMWPTYLLTFILETSPDFYTRLSNNVT